MTTNKKKLAETSSQDFDKPDQPVKIFASIAPPPLEGSFESRLYAASEQIFKLTELGVDGVIFETITLIEDIKLAVAALQKIPNSILKAVCISPSSEGILNDGNNLLSAARLVLRGNISHFGLNCLSGPDVAAKLVLELSQKTTLKLIIKPNAGLPRINQGNFIYPFTAEDFVKLLLPVLPIAQMVGGCCGTTPNHIKQLANALKDERRSQ